MAVLLHPLFVHFSRNVTKLAPSMGVTVNKMSGSITCTRQLSNDATQIELNPREGKMCAWQAHTYGGMNELQLSCSVRDPVITHPDDIIVNVSASSVNPLDLNMLGGYGATLLNTMRKAANCSQKDVMEFPLTLGRDFAGRIAAVGYGVSHLKPGDEVWGVVPPHNQGCHAQKVLVHQKNVRPKPQNLSMVEAASVLYAAITSWSALKISGDIFFTGSAQGKRILILGAAGGVGSVAVQMCKTWGAEVVGVCRADAVPYVESLGADLVVDYTQPDCLQRLQAEGKFDVVLDAAGVGPDAGPYASCLKEWANAKYITLKTPLLKNIDDHGLVLGALRSAADLVVPNVTSGALASGATLRWGFFMPCAAALDEIQLLVESGKVTPCIQKEYSFRELPAAYQHVSGGHLRGKVVVCIET